jgi:peroxiredoxin
VDLQEDRDFGELGIELVSVSPDQPESWRQVANEYGIETVLLSDPANGVADRYGVMGWRVPPSADVDSAEPGHTFVLVEAGGDVAWVRDYGAPENGGLMYVAPKDLVPELAPRLANS